MAKTIIRTEKSKEKPFVMIERIIFEDDGLSWRAKGLLGYLLSRPDNWSVCVADLCNRSTDGRDSCYAALKELGEAGYISKESKKAEAGRFAGYDYLVHESPVGKTVYGESVSGETVYGKSDTNNSEYNERELKEKECSNTSSASLEKFDHFWKLYPKKTTKKATKDAWLKIKMSDDLFKTIIEAITRQAPTFKDGFILDPVRWVKGERWEDEIAGGVKQNAKPEPKTFTEKTQESDFAKKQREEFLKHKGESK
jgi:hypothetical protein